MNVEAIGSATDGGGPLVPGPASVYATSPVRGPAASGAGSPDNDASSDGSRETTGPPPQVPPAAVAISVGETALRHVLAGQGSHGGDTSATAVELLRSVEALLRSTAPSGISSTDIGSAAERLVERQGLVARLSPSAPPNAWPADPPSKDESPSVDTRL
jgi:hypothetical protein